MLSTDRFLCAPPRKGFEEGAARNERFAKQSEKGIMSFQRVGGTDGESEVVTIRDFDAPIKRVKIRFVFTRNFGV